ncbi:hypothetical protein FB45DRAFT_865859 [Roridomyces roridus]|uniref:Uncharacterized protein n=1 Tax=Roridomyces roridus TaxID=1738132 RepID=A0AAD7FST6_9AGAR|nr:hypothetical protein FB45DRAFT_865859 [Roridomyces roridus]
MSLSRGRVSLVGSGYNELNTGLPLAEVRLHTYDGNETRQDSADICDQSVIACIKHQYRQPGPGLAGSTGPEIVEARALGPPKPDTGPGSASLSPGPAWSGLAAQAEPFTSLAT